MLFGTAIASDLPYFSRHICKRSRGHYSSKNKLMYLLTPSNQMRGETTQNTMVRKSGAVHEKEIDAQVNASGTKQVYYLHYIRQRI